MGWPRVLRNWILGSLVGVCLLTVTSPIFLRSYQTRQIDPIRGVLVLETGTHYRWRSEGYATTTIGPLGMPGQNRYRSKIDPVPGNINQPADARVADRQVILWGDSQLEGVCVADRDKIAPQVLGQSRGRINALPFASSGDNCNDWLFQIRHLESLDPAAGQTAPAVDAHVFLVTEISDWTVPVERRLEFALRPGERVFDRVSAVVIQAARNLWQDPLTGQRRRLRFMPCWNSTADRGELLTSGRADSKGSFGERTDWLAKQLAELNTITKQPCCFVYAPKSPAIIEGQLKSADDWAAEFVVFRAICDRYGWAVVDLRDLMQQSVAQGAWPRGFDNGQFGVGHYNQLGNQIIAQAIVEQLETELFSQAVNTQAVNTQAKD